MNKKELAEVEYLKSEIVRLKSEIAEHKNKLNAPTKQNPVIWGKGWYAIYDKDEDNWSVAPIDFFDKYEHCPDGWEWEIPEGFTEEEFDEFVETNGCEPTPPRGFSFCMEMCIRCNDSDWSYKEQESAFINAGYTIKEYTF